MANPARGHFSSHTNTSNAPHLSLDQTTGVREPEEYITFIRGVTFIVTRFQTRLLLLLTLHRWVISLSSENRIRLNPIPSSPLLNSLLKRHRQMRTEVFLMRKVENEEVTTREGLATASVPCCTGNRSPGQPDKRVL